MMSLNTSHAATRRKNELDESFLHPHASKLKQNDELLQVCMALNIDPSQLAQRSLNDFVTEDQSEKINRLKYEHYEKRRRVKLKHIQEFMQTTKKSKRGISYNSLPKENLLEMKKSQSNTALMPNAKAAYMNNVPIQPQLQAKSDVQRPHTHKNNQTQQISAHISTQRLQSSNRDNHLNYYSNDVFNLTQADEDSFQAEKKREKVEKIKQNKQQVLEYNESRINKIRIKSSKRDKSLLKDFKQRQEELELQQKKRLLKIEQVQARKKMMEEEQQNRLYNQFSVYENKVDKIQQQRNIFFSTRETQQTSFTNDPKSTFTANSDQEVSDKIKRYEEKMLRASFNRQRKLEQESERIRSLHEQSRLKREALENTNTQEELSTLTKIYSRFAKQRKFMKTKEEQYNEKKELKKYKEHEKQNQMRMRVEELRTQRLNNLNQDIEKSRQRHVESGKDFKDFHSDQVIEQLVKRQLIQNDQQENMRRVRAMRKLYKENLLQTLMEKDKRFKTIRKMKRDPTNRSMLADQSYQQC